MGRKCEMYSCRNAQGRNCSKSFHSFPHDTDRCLQWIQACRSPELTEKFRLGGVQEVRNLKICSDHFQSHMFKVPTQPSSGLRQEAVPHDNSTLFWNHYSNNPFNESESIVANSPPESSWRPKFEINNNESTHTTHDELSAVKSGISDHEISADVNLTDHHNDEEHPVIMSQRSRSYDDPESFKIDYKALYLKEKNVNGRLRGSVKGLRQSLKVSEKKSKWRLKSMIRNRNANKLLKTNLKRLEKQKAQDSQLLRLIKSNPVVRNSLINSAKTPKSRRYNQQMRKFAIGTYLSGPAAYRYIQNSEVLTLPSKMTVRRWTSDVHIKPGINNEIMKRLACKTQHLQLKEKTVAICIDGMSLKQELTYNAKTDTFVGFPDDGIKRRIEKNNPMILASEAVAIMISGLSEIESNTCSSHGKPRRFKQPIGYLLGHHTLGSSVQQSLVEETVRATRKCGLHPIMLVLDQGTTNVKMVREIGASVQIPVWKIDDKEMAVMYDSPHLLKNAKNMLTKHNAFFDDNIASYVHIQELFQVDQNAEPRLVPKLTDKIVNLAPFMSMNVAQAARTLSSSVASGFQYYVESEELPEKVLGTARFAEFHDKLFDTFNSKSVTNATKMYRAAITENSCHWEFLNEAEILLQNMYFTSKTCVDKEQALQESKTLTVKQRRPNYLEGFLLNINALRWVWAKLSSEFGFTHFKTNYALQDCVENLFSEIRRRCGRNDAPNAYQFGAAFKYAAISANEKLPEGTNCESDDAELLIDDDEAVLQENTDEELHSTNSNTFAYNLTPLNLGLTRNYTTKDLNGLAYITGAAAIKLSHTKCRKNLTVTLNEDEIDSGLFQFCKLKNASSYPSNKLFEVGLLAFTVYKQKFEQFLYQNRQGVKARLKQYVPYDQFDAFCCKNCFDQFVDKIFNTLINCFLRKVKLSLKMQKSGSKANVTGLRHKRNRKAVRMNLPAGNRNHRKTKN